MMKSALLHFFFCLLVIGIVGNAHAQKDYIINHKGDTLRGQIKSARILAFFSGGDKFRALEMKEFVPINPEETSLFYRSKDSTTFVAKKIPLYRKPIFVRRLQNGKIQLFECFIPGVAGYMGRTSPSQTIWYAMKESEELLEVKTNNILGTREERQNNFYGLIADYQQLLTDFKAEKNYSYEIIELYIKKYNYYFKNKSGR